MIIKKSQPHANFTFVFAIYTLSKKGSNHQYLGISTTHLIIKQRNNRYVYDLASIQNLNVDQKKKLIPLIGGGIISSLSLLAMVLDMITFDTIALLCAGLLTFYYGFTEYVVIHVNAAQVDRKFWLKSKHKITDLRPIINMITYFLANQHFPSLYVHVPHNAVPQYIHSGNVPIASREELHYSLFSKISKSVSAIIIDPAKLDQPIFFNSGSDHIAVGHHKINQSAIIGIDQPVNS